MISSQLSLNQILIGEISSNSQPTDPLAQMMSAMLGPKLHTEVPEGYCVNQGDAAISEGTLLTGGLTTCTAVVISSHTHNFVAHVDAYTDPKWLAECIEKFIQKGGQPTEVARFNSHGKELNESAERISRESLQKANLFEQCSEHNDISMMHSVGAKVSGLNGSRLISFFGKLKPDVELGGL